MSESLSAAFTPSQIRTLSVSASAEPVLCGVRIAVAPLIWPTLNAGDALDFSLDYTAWLTDANDTIKSLAISTPTQPKPSGVEVKWATFAGMVATLCLAGGNPDTCQPIVVTLTTASGRSVTLSPLLPIGCIQSAAPGAGPGVPSPAPPAGSITINGQIQS
jgi:hypothetical protein